MPTMEKKLIVDISPHERDDTSTKNIMLDVIIALVPALVAAAVIFGARAVIVVAVSVLSCLLFETLFNIICKKPNTIGDLSAVVTGILLGYNLPPALPIYMVIIGAFVAIVIVKMLFGGIGQNFANPAITGRIVLFLSFTSSMTKFTLDGVTTATPLAIMGEKVSGTLPSLTQMFLGIKGGCIGEVSVLALLIGGCYLVYKRVISPLIPVTYIATVFVLTFVLGADPLYQIMSGGLFLGAIFMATDYSTSPITTKGKVIFALGCGIITVVIRLFGAYPEGVSFAILLMNILTPHIDNLTIPKSFGVGR